MPVCEFRRHFEALEDPRVDRTKRHALPENLGSMRRIVASLLKQERSSKRGVKARGKKAAWDDGYLLKVLVG